MLLNIRQERLNRQWTLEYVAKKIGLTKTAIYDLETGKQLPSYKVLVKLEDLFNLNHRQLFAVADDTPNSQQNSTTKRGK